MGKFVKSKFHPEAVEKEKPFYSNRNDRKETIKKYWGKHNLHNANIPFLERQHVKDFIQAWEATNTIDEMMRIFGYTRMSVYWKAGKIRRAGYPLPFRKHKECGEESFCRCWNESTNVYEVAERMNMSPICAYRKMLRLRKLGYKFKKFALGLNKPDADWIYKKSSKRLKARNNIK